MTTIRDAVSSLYTELEKLSEQHDELFDTDVREALHETLSYVFVWGEPLPKMPVSYGMFSAEGDAAVAAVMERFIAAALPAASAEGLAVGQQRLDALQDESIETPAGEHFDLFIGDADQPFPAEPLSEARFSPGHYGAA